MALFTWNDSYSVNIREIDDQHKILVKLINDLHDAMKVGKGKEVMGTTIKELVDYTAYHFDHEEKLFTSNGYPESSQHKAIHEKLIAEVKTLQKNYESGNTVISMEVMNFLKDWLSGHIMGTDKKYSSFLNAKGIV